MVRNSMDSDVEPEIDWQDWLRRWDAQQEGYVPEREARFAAMLNVLDQLLPPSFAAVDLGCGPGSISQRMLARFPTAQAIAVDMDPVMLALGQGALGTAGGRLRWVDADLTSADWTHATGASQVDAVLSSTALHWLPAEALSGLYRDLARLLPPGGVFLNADHLPYGPTTPTLAQLSEHTLGDC
jgi:trans-aconitate methyltransferase